MKKVFVSGCYDILHAGHVEFFRQAKALGDYLIVSFASDKVLLKYKGYKSTLPEEHKKHLLESFSMVDEVVMGKNTDDPIFDFKDVFIELGPDILASTEDDKHALEKKKFCKTYGATYLQLPKNLNFERISTTEIRRKLTIPLEVPLRVDFAGGWLDVPKHSRKKGYIVNCTITPKVSLENWQYKKGGGLGGLAAYFLLSGENSIISELNLGVGWQDPAVMLETGLCVWRSGERPVLEMKVNPDFLVGKMALLWTGSEHHTPSKVDLERDYSRIEFAGKLASEAVVKKDLKKLSDAVRVSYKIQISEGMEALKDFGESAKKYCGGGHGGYALYIFDDSNKRKNFINLKDVVLIEPFIREY